MYVFFLFSSIPIGLVDAAVDAAPGSGVFLQLHGPSLGDPWTSHPTSIALIVLLCFVLTFLSNKTFSYSKNTYLYLKSTTQICGVHHLISIFPGLNII